VSTASRRALLAVARDEHGAEAQRHRRVHGVATAQSVRGGDRCGIFCQYDVERNQPDPCETAHTRRDLQGEHRVSLATASRGSNLGKHQRRYADWGRFRFLVAQKARAIRVPYFGAREGAARKTLAPTVYVGSMLSPIAASPTESPRSSAGSTSQS
jgi:hypothetical protein